MASAIGLFFIWVILGMAVFVAIPFLSIFIPSLVGIGLEGMLILSGVTSLLIIVLVYGKKHGAKNKDNKIYTYTMSQLDAMTGRSFEFACGNILRSCGYTNVTVTKGSNDYGADVIAYSGNDKYAIQCKRFNGNVGNSSIQEVVAAKAHYGCNKAMVMTNSYFTKNAKELARSNGVLLIDRDALRKLIEDNMVIDYNEAKEKIEKAERIELMSALEHQERYDGEWFLETRGMPIAVHNAVSFAKDVIWESVEESELDIFIGKPYWMEMNMEGKRVYGIKVPTDHPEIFKRYEQQIHDNIWKYICRESKFAYSEDGDEEKDVYIYVNKEMSV